ncbi:GNAT family N-acetyltransferase [Fredinandcohnia humi]
MIDYPALETDRMQLRLLELEQAEEVFTHFSDEEVTRFMDIEPCKDIREAEELIRYHLDDEGCRWGMYDRTSNQFLGTCGFHYIRRREDELIAEVGFDLGKAHWGKGLMREAIEKLIEFGFHEMGLSTIDATVEPHNQRSLQLMKRLGFTQEEELHEGLVYFYLKKRS